VSLSGSSIADFGFTGLYEHQRSGLCLNIYRYYNSNLGRWINRDPEEELQGANLYCYVDNSPLAFIDDSGMSKAGIIIKVVREVYDAGGKNIIGFIERGSISAKQAVNIRKAGKNVCVYGKDAKRVAKNIENSAYGVAKHDPPKIHNNRLGHYQQPKIPGVPKPFGHTFYRSLGVLTVGGTLGSNNPFGQVVDAFNPISDIRDALNALGLGDSEQ
jgi:RHS repeat-associated protein